MNKKIYLLLSVLPGTVITYDGNPPRIEPVPEKRIAYNMRVQAALYQCLQRPGTTPPCPIPNAQETAYGNYAGSFSKLLQHDLSSVNGGVLDSTGQENYALLLKALSTQKQADFNAITLANPGPGTHRLFMNPQAGYAFSMEGCDNSQLTMPAPWTLSSTQAAADMIEVYLMAICRSVKFQEYGTGIGTDFESNGFGNSITNKAAAMLNALGSAFTGPRNGLNQVDSSVLFRGKTTGDLMGPYLSQFYLQNFFALFPAGCEPFVAGLIGVGNLNPIPFTKKNLYPVPSTREFGVTWNDYIAIQNGQIPQQYNVSDYATNLQHFTCGRDMGGYVHMDGPYQPYYDAMNIIATKGFPLSPTQPYKAPTIINEGAGFDFGLPDAYVMIATVALEAFKCAWEQKWRCWRKLRPEAMAALVNQAKTTATNPYNLYSSLFGTLAGVDLLAWVQNYNALQGMGANTYLLSQMFPEGSPAHPSYPSGHATVAGACTTVLKAFFKNDEPVYLHFTPSVVDLTNPDQLLPYTGPDANLLTLAGELDKYASNTANARNFAGVHWRGDADQGLLLGEEVAIRFLQDHLRTYPEEDVVGYELTKRDGTHIRITPTKVIVL